MTRHLLKDLSEMIRKDVISTEAAEKIKEFYREKQPEARNQLFIIFGILGAILVGLGLVLIIAHNWEGMSRGLKTVWALLPMLLGQALCLYVLIKRSDSAAWREGSTAFLFFAVGACISLVGQIYNFPGTLAYYMMTWMLLVFPLMYVIRASIGSMLFIIGVSYYGLVSNFGYLPDRGPDYWYWAMLALAVPYYFMLHKKSPSGSFMIFHHWLLAISASIMLGPLMWGSENGWVLLFPLYTVLFGWYYQIGHTPFAKGPNGYLILGSMGGITVTMIGTFRGFWSAIYEQSAGAFSSVTGILSLSILIMAAVGTLIWRYQREKTLAFDPINFLFIVYLLIYLLGLTAGSISATILCNILVGALGILTIREGAKTEHLGILNYGLLILSVLIVCRFFDLNISFVIRGLMFILIGIGFFAANYFMMNRKGPRAGK